MPDLDQLCSEVDAVVFDLDGVLTNTASVHAAAWKNAFDEYLEENAGRTGGTWEPFDADSDYRGYVDGKPRYDGVRSFLTSRGIELPEGDPSDLPDAETICGVGNRKNDAFIEVINARGADLYPASVAFVRELHAHGLKTAVASSSKNCRPILDKAGIRDLFEAVFDGTDLEKHDLPGKPDPTMFLEAAKAIGAVPERACVVEDAISGVEAGSRGKFTVVIGVDRVGHPEQLAENGATIVVSDLGEYLLHDIAELPSALDKPALDTAIAGRRPAVFLDYDGTLTPIVAHPDQAILSDDMRAALEQLAAAAPVAIVSGRDVADVRDKIGVAGIYYAGSHGFDLIDPDGARSDQPPARDYLGALDAAEAELAAPVGEIPGAWVERKRFAIAVHYRQTPDAKVPALDSIVAGVAEAHPDLRRTGGKKIFELRPNFDWDKGKAVLSLMTALGVDGPEVAPIYVGDDITDEDAFRDLRGRGVGVIVAGSDHETFAQFRLPDTDAVGDLLRGLG